MNRTTIFPIAIILSLISIAHTAQPFPPPAPNTKAAQTDTSEQNTAKVPELRWFKGKSGYEKALKLQEQTKADLFVLIYNEDDKSEKGLYKWLQKKGLESTKVHSILRDYIKVKIRTNKKAHRQLAIRDFNTRKTPATFIVWPNGWNKRCNFFDWQRKRPKLLSPEEMVKIIQDNSSVNDANYQKYHNK